MLVLRGSEPFQVSLGARALVAQDTMAVAAAELVVLVEPIVQARQPVAKAVAAVAVASLVTVAVPGVTLVADHSVCTPKTRSLSSLEQ